MKKLVICAVLIVIGVTACAEIAPPVSFDQLAVTETAPPSEVQGQAMIPTRPTEFAAYADALEAYLNAAPQSVASLTAILEDWGVLDEQHGGVWQADLDNDGAAEYIVAYVDPHNETTITRPGAAMIIDRSQKWRVYPLSANPVLENFTLLTMQDVNADGRTEVAYSTMTCGAHTCFTQIEIAAWDGKQAHSLTDGAIEIPYLDDWTFIDVDRDADKALELQMHGGTIGSVGAGPQRATTDIYKWNGKVYTLTESIPDASPYLYHKVLDANAAMAEGDYEAAIKRYRQAIDDRELVVWHGELMGAEAGEQERTDLTAFARFRLLVIYATLGDLPAAQAEAAAIPPAHIYAQVARVFTDAYQSTSDVNAACQQVTAFVREHAAAYVFLNDFGYANPTFAAEDICPIEK